MPSRASTVEAKKPDLVQRKSARLSWPRRISVEVEVSNPEPLVTSPFLSTPSKQSYPQQKTEERKTSRHSLLPLTPVHSTIGKIELTGKAGVPNTQTKNKSEPLTPSPKLHEHETTGRDPLFFSPVSDRDKTTVDDGPNVSYRQANQDSPALQDSKSQIGPEEAHLASSLETQAHTDPGTIDSDSKADVLDSLLGQDAKDQEPLSLGEHMSTSQISLHVYATIGDTDSIVSGDEEDAPIVHSSRDGESQSPFAMANTISTSQPLESAHSVSGDKTGIEPVSDTKNLQDHGRAEGTYKYPSSTSITLPKVQATAEGPQSIESTQYDTNPESLPTENPDQLRLLQEGLQIAKSEEVNLRKNDTQPQLFSREAKASNHLKSEADPDETLYQYDQPEENVERESHDTTAEGDNDISRSKLELDGRNVQKPLPEGKCAFSSEPGSNGEESRPYRLERSQSSCKNSNSLSLETS